MKEHDNEQCNEETWQGRMEGKNTTGNNVMKEHDQEEYNNIIEYGMG